MTDRLRPMQWRAIGDSPVRHLVASVTLSPQGGPIILGCGVIASPGETHGGDCTSVPCRGCAQWLDRFRIVQEGPW